MASTGGALHANRGPLILSVPHLLIASLLRMRGQDRRLFRPGDIKPVLAASLTLPCRYQTEGRYSE
jgi:hypothetical protein